VGCREGKIPLGRHKNRWDDNTKMDLKVGGSEGLDWIYLGRDIDKWKALVTE
jgi:hypothetical protein